MWVLVNDVDAGNIGHEVLMPRTLSLRTPRGMGTSTSSPICLPTKACPMGLVIKILF